jgi:hypothetical protein
MPKYLGKNGDGHGMDLQGFMATDIARANGHTEVVKALERAAGNRF